MFFKPTEDELQQLIKLTQEYDTRIEQAANEDEKKALHDECGEKLAALFLEIDKRRLKKIIGNPDAILEDAKFQIETAILHAYEELVKYGKDREKYMSFATGEARLISQLAADIAKDEISLYFDALKDNPEYTKRLFSLIAEIVKTSEYTDNEEVTLAYEPQGEPETPLNRIPVFAPIPNSAAFAFLSRALNNTRPGNKKKGTKPRYVKNNPGNRHEEIKRAGDYEHVIIERKNKQSGEIITLEFDNPELIFKSGGKALCKMLDFSMQEMNAQHFPYKVDIRVQDLIDRGMYKNLNTARTAVYNFFNLQTNIKVGGSDKRGRNKAKYPRGVLFYHYEPCENGHISLYVNNEIDIDFYAHYFTIMPQYAYALSDNGYALMRYIFYLARQKDKMKSIREKGSFNISLDTIREVLGFPAVDEVKNRKYKQYIIKPITNAVNESMKAWEATEKEEGDAIEIIMHGTDTTNIKEWLQGYIEVKLSGSLANYFIDQINKSEKELARLKKLREEAQARAIANKKVKNIE